jgi:hypothetical protein
VIELLRAVQENSLVYSKQKKTLTQVIPGTEICTLYLATPRTEGSSVRVTQAVACDQIAALALGKELPLRKLVLLPPIFKSSLRVLIHC